MKRVDLTAQTFGRLTVVAAAASASNGNARWLCRCECGNATTVDGYALRKGLTASCGCLQREIARATIKQTPRCQAQMASGNRFAKTAGVNVAAASKRRSTNRSGVVGVSFERRSGKWLARLMVQHRLVLDRRFTDFQAAVNARRTAEAEFLAPLRQQEEHS